ncbi:MAG: hypothetical protein Q9174_000734 [Haloplaca sp. 1 TL-2023]
MAIKRSVSISLLLFILIPLLSTGFLREKCQSLSKLFVVRELQRDLNPTGDASTYNVRTVALLFGQQEHVANFTFGPDLTKRATFDYEYAKCKGESLWQMVQAAFNGQRPAGRDFTRNDLDNGWTESAITGGLGGLPAGWDPAFKTFANNRVPTSAELHHLRAIQDKSFRNTNGNTVQVNREIVQCYRVAVTNTIVRAQVEENTSCTTSQVIVQSWREMSKALPTTASCRDIRQQPSKTLFRRSIDSRIFRGIPIAGSQTTREVSAT